MCLAIKMLDLFYRFIFLHFLTWFMRCRIRWEMSSVVIQIPLMLNISKIIVRSSSASRCDEYFNVSLLIANSVDQLTQWFVFHKSCEYSHTHSLHGNLFIYLVVCPGEKSKCADTESLYNPRAYYTISYKRAYMGKQKDKQIKLNNQPKFVSFLNLNSKQTTKESHRCFFRIFLFITVSHIVPQVSLLACLCFILCAHPRGGAINQSTVELCKIQLPEKTTRLSLYIYNICTL